MKRILALLLAFAMLFCLTACGGDKESIPTGENTGASTNTTESTTDPTDDAQNGTQGTTDNIASGENTNTGNDSPTTPSDTQSNFPDMNNGYLVFEKQNGEYRVIGITDAAPNSIVIPDKYDGLPVKSIGSWAFAYNENITSITISNSVSSIGECAFEQCYNLKTVSIGNGVTTIGKGAFRCCTSLTSINIPSNVKNINEAAFEGCSKLSSVTLPSGVQKIGNSAFVGTALTNVTIPNSVTSIGESIFNNCGKLTSVVIGSGISQISNGAFSYCDKLTSVTISGSVKNISAYAFYLCENLNNIAFTGTKGSWKSITTGESWNYGVPATKVTCSDGTISLTGNTEPTPTNPTPTDPQPVHVSGVQISKTSLSLNVGDTQQLTATVSPSNADNKNVTWSSSNSAVAQVSSTGKITAKGAGSATITVTTVDGNYTAKCTVTVAAPPATEPPTTEPPATEPVSDVLIISNTQTISNQTIDTDVYITSTGVATFNNVTVNGNIYCYGQLKCSGCTANNVYAYAYGSMMSCGAFDGTHGKVSGGINCNNMTILDNALDYAFNKWGKR